MAGRISVNELREVSIDDLLGREPVSLDWEQISEGLGGKSVLVSGGVVQLVLNYVVRSPGWRRVI